MLVIAIGAHPEREWHSDAVLTYHDGRDGPDYRLLLHQLREGRLDSVAFVKPAGPSWPLPLYDLALLTAADCAAHERSDGRSEPHHPGRQPLAIFGSSASAAIRGLLRRTGVTLHTSSYGTRARPGLAGHHARRPRGARRPHRHRAPPRRATATRHSQRTRRLHPHRRPRPTRRTWTAYSRPGTRRAFPIKQGGLAAQQADAVAEAIAASVGAAIDPQPFRPILRGVLLTGGPARYLRADISGGAGDDSTISGEALWWPPEQDLRTLPRAVPQQPDRRRGGRHAGTRARDTDRDPARRDRSRRPTPRRRALGASAPLGAPPGRNLYRAGGVRPRAFVFTAADLGPGVVGKVARRRGRSAAATPLSQGRRTRAARERRWGRRGRRRRASARHRPGGMPPSRRGSRAPSESVAEPLARRAVRRRRAGSKRPRSTSRNSTNREGRTIASPTTSPMEGGDQRRIARCRRLDRQAREGTVGCWARAQPAMIAATATPAE